MVLGLLPAIRGGLGDLARTGQHSRLIDGYLRPYARAFDEVHYFSYLDESLGQYAADHDLAARVRLHAGTRFHPWLQTLGLPLRHASTVRRCDVLRAFQVTGAIPGVIAKRLYGVPFAVTYGFWYGRLARSRTTAWLRRMTEALALGAADAVIVTTPALGNHVVGRVGAARVHLIANGVDTERFRPSPRPASDRKNVLYVGRLSEEKNLPRLVEALAAVTTRVPLTLTVVGDGPLRDVLGTRARTAGLATAFVPAVDHLELPKMFAAADAFVLPSCTEGHSKVLLEAMSSGLPCLASAVGGNLETLTDEHDGLLFDPGDTAAIAKLVERVLTDAPLARRLGAAARATVLERYRLDALVAQEIALLRRIGSARS